MPHVQPVLCFDTQNWHPKWMKLVLVFLCDSRAFLNATWWWPTVLHDTHTAISHSQKLTVKRLHFESKQVDNFFFNACHDSTSLTSSRLKSTPPTGAPKATETPAAAAADKTSRFFASFLAYFGNRRPNTLPQQAAMCTSGPSFPRLRFEATASGAVIDLISNVHFPR